MTKTKDQQLLATIKGRTESIYKLSLIIDIKQRTRLADFMLSESLCDALDDIDHTMSQTLVSLTCITTKDFFLVFFISGVKLYEVTSKIPSSVLSSRSCYEHNAF